MSLEYQTNIQFLKGVGPKLSELFAKRHIHTVADLLHTFPRTFEDRRAHRRVDQLIEGEVVSLKVKILRINHVTMGRSHRKMTEIVVSDETGRISCRFFRTPYRGYFEQFAVQDLIVITGKVVNYRNQLQFQHPEMKKWDETQVLEDSILPIYPEIENLSSAKIHFLIKRILQELRPSQIEDPLPQQVREKYQLHSKARALQEIHLPAKDVPCELYLKRRSPAHRRLIFEEFFLLETFLAARRMGFRQEQATQLLVRNQLKKKFLEGLPFVLTNAQARVINEVEQDLALPRPMCRLVQGDVGSGKTMVAWCSALVAIENHSQVALMAPTEILAEQHYRNAEKLLTPLGVKIGFLSGTTKARERQALFQELGEGRIDLLIGTHALIEEGPVFKNLTLVIIDEQHRFGVQQRAKLKQKGISPHFLLMTATPIPRTLAMTVYGDLEVSVIDEMPPGRSPIKTRVVPHSRRGQVFSYMREVVARGEQVYVVYPLIEESEKIDLKNAQEEYLRLQQEFPDIQFGLLHGRMKAEEKEQLMLQFRQNQIQVLVSTTVIEVGVDVPNATMMIIEHAERFGLSQLHQLRGRVGRGSRASVCALVLGFAVSDESRERTQFMESTTDGFKIAEFDLKLRGPGEFLGTKQSGLPGFQLAHLLVDTELLLQAREAAFAMIESDPGLKSSEHQQLREMILNDHGAVGLITA